MHIPRPHHRRVHIHATPDPAATAPVIDLAARIRRIASDIGHDLGDRGRGAEVQGRQAGAGQGIEEAPDEGRDVARVLRIAVVNIARRAREEIGALERHAARGAQARRAVDVHRHRHGAGVVAVAGGAEPALDPGEAAVRARDRVPEGAAAAGEGVVPALAREVEVAVRGDGVVVLVVVRLDGRAFHLDEGVGVVEQARTHGRVVDPRGWRQAAELVGARQRRQHGRVPDAGFHEQFGRFQRPAGDDDAAFGRQRDGAGDSADVDDDARGLGAGAGDPLHPGAALKLEVGPLQRRLEVADDGPAAFAVGVVVDRVAEDFGLPRGVGVDVEFGVAGVGDKPLLCGRVARLLVIETVQRRIVGRWLCRVQPGYGGHEVSVLPACGKVQIEVGRGWLIEKTCVDCTVALLIFRVSISLSSKWYRAYQRLVTRKRED